MLPTLTLGGPTSFAPLIRKAISIVQASQNRYHILLIIADGQLSEEGYQPTVDAIVEASNYPLSIVMVGVGDGPWDDMEEFDDELRERRFDNFQFVDYDSVMRRNDGDPLAFACAAMQEIPEQYQAMAELGLFEVKPAVSRGRRGR